ncbi:MAG TPA: HAMP domain-containing sensor histidine kinase [Candidatus Tumulicola sp.]
MTRLARRLHALLAIETSLILAGALALGGLFAFGFYIRSLSNELQGTRTQLTAALAQMPFDNARAAGTFAASRLLQWGTELVFLDADSRVTVFRSHRADAAPTTDVRPRGDLSGDPEAPGAIGRSILGLATAFGLEPLHAHAGNLYVIVKANDAVLVASVRSFLVPLAVAIGIAIALGILISGALARQALRPLDDVTAALARFAAGDLTPHPIAADHRHELAALATAYNGAIAQMENAFTQRDRANASMRQFIADAGHQLRTPLTVVRGFIAVLRGHQPETESDREHILDTMNRQSQIMSALIHKLILLERWEVADSTADPEPIDVGILVADFATAIADAHPHRGVTIEAENGILCGVDPIELGYVVNNLLDNALRYANGRIAVVVRSDDGFAVVEVGDEGPGIAASDAVHVFDRFYRARRDVEGSGLGLAIAKAAVERARGTIALETAPGSGSRFIVRLPRC